MTLQELRTRKRELGYTNEMLAERSGIPLSTVQKVISGATKSPRRHTLEALWNAMNEAEAPVNAPKGLYDTPPSMPMLFGEAVPKYDAFRSDYTIEDIYALPEGIIAELIDGRIYFRGTPTRTHQKISGELFLAVAGHIRAHNGTCEVYFPPFGVYLFGDDSTYLVPDLVVVCDTSKLEEKGCVGAPDWVVEVLSPSTCRMDLGKKLFRYRKAGVKEYWIIYPEKRMVTVYLFSSDETKEDVTIYPFEAEIPCSLFPDLKIRLADHL